MGWHDDDQETEEKTSRTPSPSDEAAERLNEILRKAKAAEKEAELARQLKDRKG